MHHHLHLQSIVLAQLLCIKGDLKTGEDEPHVTELLRSDRGGSDHGDLVDEAAATNVEVKGGDRVVNAACEARVPLDVEANDLG
ncbi:hypothetical protein NL676_013969 [Syzygium grande]|nr:hypothetical protein NL676_013969 [Syzygium grande]